MSRSTTVVDLLLSVRYLGIPSRGESYVLCDYVFVVNDSFQPLHTTIIDDCRDVHSLLREAIATASTGRYRFSNIAGVNIPATILKDHWRYLPGWQHIMFKVLQHVDGETINSPVRIHEDNDIETQPVIGRSVVSRGIDLYILCLFKIYIYTYSRKAKQDVHIKFKRGTCFGNHQAKIGGVSWSFA
jgi:hypothetical protein